MSWVCVWRYGSDFYGFQSKNHYIPTQTIFHKIIETRNCSKMWVWVRVSAHNVHWACMHAYQKHPLKFHFISFARFIRSSRWMMDEIVRIDRPSLTGLAHKMQTSNQTKPNRAIAVNCINNDITTRTSNGIRLQSPILNNAFRWFLLLRYLDLNAKIHNKCSKCVVMFIRITKFLLSSLCCALFQFKSYLLYHKCSLIVVQFTCSKSATVFLFRFR